MQEQTLCCRDLEYIYIFFEILAARVLIGQLGCMADLAQFRLNQLHCLYGIFNALTFKKTFSKSLKHIL